MDDPPPTPGIEEYPGADLEFLKLGLTAVRGAPQSLTTKTHKQSQSSLPKLFYFLVKIMVLPIFINK